MTPRRIRIFALSLLFPVGVLGVFALESPAMNTVLAHGPIQVGHEELACADCHRAPEASWRQQIQANVQYALGTRAHPVDFGYQPITSVTCIGCHDRPNDRHPIYRFREARFRDALDVVDATSCLGCHTEHTDERAFAALDFCQACHEPLELKSDPLDIDHVTLIKADEWESCLGCHDFHGNHVHRVPTVVAEAFNADPLHDYLKSGPSPYGITKQYEGKTP